MILPAETPVLVKVAIAHVAGRLSGFQLAAVFQLVPVPPVPPSHVTTALASMYLMPPPPSETYSRPKVCRSPSRMFGLFPNPVAVVICCHVLPPAVASTEYQY